MSASPKSATRSPQLFATPALESSVSPSTAALIQPAEQRDTAAALMTPPLTVTDRAPTDAAQVTTPQDGESDSAVAEVASAAAAAAVDETPARDSCSDCSKYQLKLALNEVNKKLIKKYCDELEDEHASICSGYDILAHVTRQQAGRVRKIAAARQSAVLPGIKRSLRANFEAAVQSQADLQN